jgi:hypothetical protein
MNQPIQGIELTTKQNLLRRYLTDIWNMGDRDEMSWKHIGHGSAALLATDNWRECLDYRRPNERLTPEEYTKLDALWFMVKDTMNKNGKQWFIDTLAILSEVDSRMIYADTYLKCTWMGYRPMIEKQNLIVGDDN